MYLNGVRSPISAQRADSVLLLVEDDPDAAQILRLTFARAGFRNQLIVVRDGQEALEYLEGQGRFSDRSQFPLPQIIFLDLKMPRMDGFEFLKWLRQTPAGKTIPVIVLTSSVFNSDLVNSYKAGANSFLVKGTDADEILAQVTAVGAIWLRGQSRIPEFHPG